MEPGIDGKTVIGFDDKITSLSTIFVIIFMIRKIDNTESSLIFVSFVRHKKRKKWSEPDQKVQPFRMLEEKGGIIVYLFALAAQTRTLSEKPGMDFE